jgi:hypothetical protein
MANLAWLSQQLGQPFPPAGTPGLTGTGPGTSAPLALPASAGAAGTVAGTTGTAAVRYSQNCRLASGRVPGSLPACAVTATANMTTGSAGSAAGSARAAAATASAASMEEPDLQNVANSAAVVSALPLPSRPGDVVRFEGNGDVALVDPSGLAVWDREPQTFAPDWQVSQLPTEASGYTYRDNPTILAGPSPLEPAESAGTPYAVGLLAGRQDPVVAVGHFAYLIGGNMPAGDLALPNSFVTVLDGRTGATLWSHEYPGLIMQLTFADGHLIVGDTAGPASQLGLWGLTPGGPAGTVSSLDDWAFRPAGSGLDGSLAGRVTIHSPNALWLALAPAGPGTVVAAWTDTPLGVGMPGVPDGHVLALSVALGRVRWSVATAGYPRQLAYDSSRGQVVVTEQADPTQALSYTLTGLRTANGAVAGQIVRDNAMPFETLQVADVTGGGAASWLVTEQPYVPCQPPFQDYTCLGNSQAVAFTPGSEAPAWTSQVPPGGPAFSGSPREAYGLLVARGSAGPEVVVASQQLNALPSTQTPLGDFTQDLTQLGPYSDLRALAGSDGHLLWDQSGGDEVSPQSIEAVSLAGRPAVVSVNSEQDVRIFAADDGSPLASSAMFAGGMFTAASADVAAAGGPGQSSTAAGGPGQSSTAAGGPGQSSTAAGAPELIVGGESGGVFALAGNQLGSTPHILWHTSLGAPVHHIAVVQLDPSGPPSLVVAATDKLAVLSLDGAVRYQVSFPGQFVWTFAAGNLGNGSAGIVVPTNALTALDGPSGKQLWRYQPDGGSALFSVPAISAKGTVVTEYAVPPANFAPPGDATDQTVAGLNGSTGSIVWKDGAASPSGAFTQPLLDGGVAAGPDIGGANGDGVALAWSEGSTADLGSTEVDVRDDDTGALQYTKTVPGFNAATLATGSAFGLAVCGSSQGGGGPSIAGIAPGGVTLQRPGNAGCSAAAAVGSDFVVAQPAQLWLLAAPGSYPLAGGGPVTPVYDSQHDIAPSSVAAVTLGHAAGYAAGLSYDWEVEQDLGIPMNSFGFLLTSAFVPSGLVTYPLP